MSTTQRDIYSSHATFPVLGSTLLPAQQQSSPLEGASRSKPSTDPTSRSIWNIERSMNDYSRLEEYTNDRRKLLRCGAIVGISYLKEWGTISDTEQNQSLLGDVARRLLTLFLVGVSHDVKATERETSPVADAGSKPEQESGEDKIIQTRVYIVHPVQSAMFGPETLFNDLVRFRHDTNDYDDDGETGSPISDARAISILDRVELLPVHDFSSATQAIGQVSDAISKTHDLYRQEPEQIFSDGDNDNNASSDHGNGQHGQPPTTLLIVEGLDTMVEDIIHNSNALRGSAVLTTVLRALTRLSRTHASFLSILIVNTKALGPSMPPPQQSQSLETPTVPSLSSQSPFADERITAAATGGLFSAFSQQRTTAQHAHQRQQLRDVENDDRRQLQMVPLLSTLLSRTLDQGIDTHLLLQARKPQILVEVIKDRMGNGLGKWCVWE